MVFNCNDKNSFLLLDFQLKNLRDDEFLSDPIHSMQDLSWLMSEKMNQ